MFKITSTLAITWPELSLQKGENVFTSRKAVPESAWPKLERFRARKLLDFEGEAHAKDAALAKLEDVTERQLFDMGKEELLELARANGITAADDAKKKDLLDALVPKCKPLPKLEPEPATDAAGKPDAAPAAASSPAAAAGKRGRQSTPVDVG